MKERKDYSRAQLLQAAHHAIGAYTEQEAKKEDQWRDEPWWKLYNHISHEIKEIKRSKTLTIKLHNCNDLVGLSLILLARTMEEAGYFLNEAKDE